MIALGKNRQRRFRNHSPVFSTKLYGRVHARILGAHDADPKGYLDHRRPAVVPAAQYPMPRDDEKRRHRLSPQSTRSLGHPTTPKKPKKRATHRDLRRHPQPRNPHRPLHHMQNQHRGRTYRHERPTLDDDEDGGFVFGHAQDGFGFLADDPEADRDEDRGGDVDGDDERPRDEAEDVQAVLVDVRCRGAFGSGPTEPWNKDESMTRGSIRLGKSSHSPTCKANRKV